MNRIPRIRNKLILRLGLIIALVLGVSLLVAAVTSAFQPLADGETVLASELTVTKTFASNTVYPGKSSSFTIEVSWDSDPPGDSADNVLITDTVTSPDLPFTAVSVEIDDPTGSCEEPGTTITCTVPALADQASVLVTVNFTVDNDAPAGEVSNTAYATTTTVAGTFQDTDTVVIGQSTTLEAIKTFDQDTVNAGEDSFFTIVVSNTGSADAINVLITDTVDLNLEINPPVTINPSGGNSCGVLPGQKVSCLVPTLAVDEKVTITVNFTVDSAAQSDTPIGNVASATAENADSVDSPLASLNITENTSLLVTKSFADDPIDSGETSSFTIEVTNDGPAISDDVKITDSVDGDLSVTGVNIVGGGSCEGPSATISCTVPSLAVGGTVVVTVDFEAIATTTKTIDNMATATDEDSNTAQDSDSVDVQAPDLVITKAYQGDVIAGLEVDYTLTYTNTDHGIAKDPVVTDVLPVNIEWVSGGSYEPGTRTITWSGLENLQFNESGQVMFSAELGCSGTVTNNNYRVSVSNPDVTSPTGPPVTFMIQAATINASFTQSAAEVDVGETVTFNASATTTNGPNLTYEWDFGDGSTATGVIVNHVYDSGGTKTVTLTVSDGCTEAEVSRTVLVKTFIFLPILRTAPEWESVGNFVSTEDALSAAVCSSDSNLIFAGTREVAETSRGKLWQFNGTSWSPASGFPTDKAVIEVIMDTSCQNAFAAVQGDGVWHGARSGNNWNWAKLTGGVNVSSIRDIVLVGNRVFAGGSFGVSFINSPWRSNNWQTTNAPGSISMPVMDLAVGDPVNNAGPIYLVQWQNRKVWRNTNPDSNPASWSEISSLSNLPDANVTRVAGNMSNVVFVGTTSRHYYRSGSSWAVALASEPLAFVVDGIRAYAGYTGSRGVYLASDGGATMSAINKGWAPPKDIFGLTVQQNTIYAATSSGVFKRLQ